MSRDISNSDDMIDSRQIIERIEELDGMDERDEAETEELRVLKELAEECSGYANDWEHGEALIRRSHWVEYVQELCEDIGDVPKNLPHYIEIDWSKTADNIEVDYTTVDYDGVEYLIRSC